MKIEKGIMNAIEIIESWLEERGYDGGIMNNANIRRIYGRWVNGLWHAY